MKVSASIYLGLKDYTLEDNLKYLKKLKECSIDTVFISAHMPEMDQNFSTQLLMILKESKKENFKIILDVNKNRYMELVEEHLLDGIYALRLDYGFSKEDILKMLNQPYLIELNASAISIGTLEYLKEQQVDFSRIRISHNFYPKPYTGLSYEDVLEKNDYYHAFGLHVICYIPSHHGKRPPLYEGLPTIEEQRNADLLAILSEIVMVHGDEVCFGDAFASEEELKEAIEFDTNILSIPILLYPGICNHEKKLLEQVHQNRKDANVYFIRSSCRVDGIKERNTLERTKGSITIDNEKFGRYQGEVGIMKQDLPCDERVNVIGKALVSSFLLKSFAPGQKFKFVIRGEEK